MDCCAVWARSLLFVSAPHVTISHTASVPTYVAVMEIVPVDEDVFVSPSAIKYEQSLSPNYDSDVSPES